MKDQEELPRQPVNLGDTAQIKRVLDEAASQVGNSGSASFASAPGVTLHMASSGFARIAKYQ